MPERRKKNSTAGANPDKRTPPAGVALAGIAARCPKKFVRRVGGMGRLRVRLATNFWLFSNTEEGGHWETHVLYVNMHVLTLWLRQLTSHELQKNCELHIDATHSKFLFNTYKPPSGLQCVCTFSCTHNTHRFASNSRRRLSPHTLTHT